MDQHYFDEIALKWDRIRESAFNEAVRDHAISVANVHPGTEGLAADIGVGTGFIAQGLIDRGLFVIAIDHSINMLRVLKTKMPNARALAFCQGDAERLPLCGDAVDYVFANMCLHHLAHPRRAVGEMTRILRMGGRLVITDLEAHHYAFLTKERRDRWLGFEHAELKRWLCDAGLTDVNVHDTGERVSVRSSSSDVHAQIGIVVASGDKLGRAGRDGWRPDGPFLETTLSGGAFAVDVERISNAVFALAKLVYVDWFSAREEFRASKVEQRLNALIEGAGLHCVDVARFCHDFANKDSMVSRVDGVDDATFDVGRTLSNPGRLYHDRGNGCQPGDLKLVHVPS